MSNSLNVGAVLGLCLLLQACSSEDYSHELTMPYYDECGPVIQGRYPNPSGAEIKVVKHTFAIPSMGSLKFWRPATGYVLIRGVSLERIELLATGIVSGCYPWGGVSEKIVDFQPVNLGSLVKRYSRVSEYLYFHLSEHDAVLLYNPDLDKY